MEGRGSQVQHERNEVAKLTQMKSKVNRLRRSPKAAPLNPGQIRNTGNKSPQNQTQTCLSLSHDRPESDNLTFQRCVGVMWSISFSKYNVFTLQKVKSILIKWDNAPQNQS